MSIFEYNARSMGQKIAQRSLVSLLSLALLFATFPVSLSAQDQDAQALPPQDQGAPQDNQAPPRAQQTPEQLQRLVAPIALYPDSRSEERRVGKECRSR